MIYILKLQMDRIPSLKYLALFSVWKSAKESRNYRQVARLNDDLLHLLFHIHRLKRSYFEVSISFDIGSNISIYIDIDKFQIDSFHKNPNFSNTIAKHFVFFLEPYSKTCFILKFKDGKILSYYFGPKVVNVKILTILQSSSS